MVVEEKWDCLYVDRIENDGQIVLEKPQRYGIMYISQKRDFYKTGKVRKSIPKECGEIKGSSIESKILVATSIATALNQYDLSSSEGLVVRRFKVRTPLPGLQTALIETRGSGLRDKGSTGWLVYISPEEGFYHIVGTKLGERFPTELTEKVRSCIRFIESERR